LPGSLFVPADPRTSRSSCYATSSRSCNAKSTVLSSPTAIGPCWERSQPVFPASSVDFGGHYGATIATCVARDPETKGGSEATVKIAKADLVPTDANLRSAYEDWGELVTGCGTFMDKVNSRPHRVTARPPVEALAEEQTRLHRLPVEAFAVVFGETRRVTSTSTINFGGVAYSVPHELIGDTVWVLVQGNEVVLTHQHRSVGAVEVARHPHSTPGNPQILDQHYPPVHNGPLDRRPYPTNRAEAEFLALGEGAKLWLTEAAAAGTYRLKAKMADAVTMSRIHGPTIVDEALGQAATHSRFAEGDLASIITARPPAGTRSASENHSLQTPTTAWEGFGSLDRAGICVQRGWGTESCNAEEVSRGIQARCCWSGLTS